MAPVLDSGVFTAPHASAAVSLNDICFSSACVQTAASLLQSMDMNIDPCSDFYQYTCGNWIRDAIIPEDLAGFGVIESDSTYHKDKFRTILDGSYFDMLTATKSRSSFQVDTKDGINIDKKNFRVVKNYYTSCIEVESSGNEALSSFFNDVDELMYETTQTNKTQFQLTARAMEIVSYPKSTDAIVIEVGGLFTMEILPKENDRTKMTIIVYPPSEFSDTENAPLQDEDSNKLFSLTSSLLGFQNATDRDRERVSLLEDTGLKMMTDPEIYAIIGDAISVQSRLHELSKASDDSTFISYSLDELSDALPFVHWASIIESNVPQDRDISDLYVQIFNVEYFQELEYYSSVDDPTRKLHKDAIANYLVLHKIYQDASKLDAEMRRIMPDTPFQTRSNLCVEKVLENLHLVSGRFYSMFTSNGESDRVKLSEMAEAIKESLGNRIKKASWLDNSTRSSAIRKLDAMQKSIGYSTASPDERSPKDIHEFLRGLEADADNFYDNEKAVAQWTLQIYWDTIGRTISPTEWVGVATPQVVNAFNLLSKNSIFVSAAFAQKPNYDKYYPDYLNYGGIGQTLGHEFSHAFDDYGSQYDEFGIERNWWSEETKYKYMDKSQCFIDQYSKASIIDEKGKKYAIDGSLTLGENIADNEGLAATYDAYIKSKENGAGYNPILPGLQDFSPEALFFINAGRSFCSKPLPGSIKDSIKDEHAPDAVRANKVFQNSKEFAQVFKCPIGSKMNPANTEKCSIW
ncbi:unnamed protein product [Mucor circinelloides]